MAKNFVQEGRYLFLTVGAGVVSGSPVAVGDITGVTTIDADANNQATVDTEGVYDLSVEANDGGASQVDPGDAIYYNAADTPKVAGVLYGYALETIAAAGTDTINVKLAKK